MAARVFRAVLPVQWSPFEEKRHGNAFYRCFLQPPTIPIRFAMLCYRERNNEEANQAKTRHFYSSPCTVSSVTGAVGWIAISSDAGRGKLSLELKRTLKNSFHFAPVSSASLRPLCAADARKLPFHSIFQLGALFFVVIWQRFPFHSYFCIKISPFLCSTSFTNYWTCLFCFIFD